MNPPKTEESSVSELCPCCGSRLDAYTPRTRSKDVAVTILCAILLLAIAVPAAWATEQWMELAGEKFVNHMVIWHEPIESWNR
jgi:hypothetical protein